MVGSPNSGHQQLATQFNVPPLPKEGEAQTSIQICVKLSEKVSMGKLGQTGTHYLVKLDAKVPLGQKDVH